MTRQDLLKSCIVTEGGILGPLPVPASPIAVPPFTFYVDAGADVAGTGGAASYTSFSTSTVDRSVHFHQQLPPTAIRGYIDGNPNAKPAGDFAPGPALGGTLGSGIAVRVTNNLNATEPGFEFLRPITHLHDGRQPSRSDGSAGVADFFIDLGLKHSVKAGTSAAGFELVRGSARPFGATAVQGGVNFALFAKHASAITLVIFLPDDLVPLLEFPLDPKFHKTGDVWHCRVSFLGPGIHYGYRIDNGDVLLDPYGKAVWGRPQWGEGGSAGLRSVVVDDHFAWEHDQPLGIPLADSVIYELHVRGFTRHESSGVHAPGTFLGLCEKIPYLQSLGVTAVELLPVADFEETGNRRRDPSTGAALLDYWGYNPFSFFAPKLAYSSGTDSLAAVLEFKEMVKRFHAAGIEVILDVVFNHTGEGNAAGPTLSWRGIDDETYYLKDPQSGRYLDYSGCGNTLNCNHPVVRNQIIDSLHYWVTEMHVDGFRFDLASVLGRGRDGNVLANPPVLEQISADPILAGTKLIAEAWDAAGLYQVGSFPAWGRWAEWNGRFRDDIRKFVRGDPGMAPALATRLAGSADLYQGSGRQPFHSINFVTCHDGFTLADLVSYNHKHNERNGEDNRDGSNDNVSWNCGVEGPTSDREIQMLRDRQVRNLAALLLLAHGTPMLLAGDESGRTQNGNNNAYCQDNETAWLDWRWNDSNRDLFRFVRGLIQFRRDHAVLRRSSFVPDGDTREIVMQWGGRTPGAPDWTYESRLLSLHLFEAPSSTHGEQIYLIANAHWESAPCRLPPLTWGQWRRVADTSLAAPADIADAGHEIEIEQDQYVMNPRSVVILVGKATSDAGLFNRQSHVE